MITKAIPKLKMLDCFIAFALSTLPLIITLFAWRMQNNLFFSWDNSILLHETERMLKGGNYLNNFFETSPPMILYLYIPVILLSKLFSLSLITTFRAYIFALTFMCLWLYEFLMRQIFLKKDFGIHYLAFFSLIVLLLIYPSFELGQRDCLFMIFCLPYFIAAVLNIQNIKLNRALAIFIGCLAGLGVGIKPHFIIMPLLIESYIFLSTKNWKNCFRLETSTLLMVLSIYTITAFLLYPEYFIIITPYAMRLYYSGVASSWLNIILHPINISATITLFFYLTQRKQLGEYKTFTDILAVALIGFMLIFISQRTLFYYHAIPPLTFMLFLNIILISLIYQRSITIKNTGSAIKNMIILSLVVFGLLTYPILLSYNMYLYNAIYAHNASPILSYLKTHTRHRSVYLFSNRSWGLFPLIEYADTISVSRFPFFWMMPGLVNHSAITPTEIHQQENDKNFLINMISEDLRLKKPDYVFVDISQNKQYIKKQNFEFLPYFLSSKNFQTAWKNYYFTTIISGDKFDKEFQFAVYQRITPNHLPNDVSLN